MIAAILSLSALGVTLGALLGVASRHFKLEQGALEGEIEALLPGSQCGQCGYPGCGPAAAALASGDAPVTLCPPGGRALAQALAEKLGVEVDLSGVEERPPQVAYIHEKLCIGCTKCMKRCPTDAIMGANGQVHAIFEDACTGCEKCFDVCQTSGIEMRPVTPTLQTWYWPLPESAAR